MHATIRRGAQTPRSPKQLERLQQLAIQLSFSIAVDLTLRKTWRPRDKDERGATVMSNSMRKRLLATSLFLGASALCQPVMAQTTSNPELDAGEEEAIVVTGTRIARPGFTSNSPIATIGAQELQLQQPVNVEELLRDQPQFSPGNGSQVNNGSSGTATLDLRGLSEPRTLPLINGTRMVGFDPNGLFDTNSIPLALLERVDVVTGGASAVYGSDAVAGVVNFILKDDFEGVDVRASHSWNDLHDTGDSDNLDMTLGATFDGGRGNVALSIGWLEREPVYQINGPAALAPGRSSFSTPTAFDNAVGGRTQFDSNGQLGNGQPYQFFDFNGQNLYQGPTERWNATAVASYEINPNVEAYARFIFNSSTVDTQSAASAVFGDVLEIPLANPFLTAQASNYLATHNSVSACSNTNAAFASGCVNVATRWRAVDVGPRLSRFQYDTFQTLAGLRGEIGESGWDWDIALAHGETSLNRQQNNDVNLDRIRQAMFATSTTACADPADGCTPLNIFNTGTGPSAAAQQFISLNLQVQALTKQDYVVASASGEIANIHSPFATSPVSAAFGAEYRNESSDFRPDFPSQQGLSPGFGTTNPVSGEFDVMEFFGEALVPLVEGAPLAQAINLELGYRTSEYSISGRVESYKYGLDWEPLDGLRFRGMFQRAVRAPNIADLFAPNTGGTGDLLIDPCSGVTLASNATLYNLCVATGVPAPQTLAQPTAGQANNFIGGNPMLTPEEADTITIGFVVQPSFWSGFRATVDYFDVEINNAISVRPAFDIVDGCYDAARNPTANPLAADCRLLIREPTTGSLDTGGDAVGIVQRTQNIGQVHVEGIDYGFAYDWDFGGLGSLAISFDGTHLLAADYTPSEGAGTVDCVGYFGKNCGLPSTVSAGVGGPVSEDKWVQRTTWSLGDWEFSYRWRHLSAVDLDPQTAAEAPFADTPIDPNLAIDAYDYIDLSTAWQVTDAMRLSASVTNVTDQDAPFIPTGAGPTTFNSGNTYPSTYDVLGRVFTVGVQARF